MSASSHSSLEEDLLRAESFLLHNQNEDAHDLLLRLAADAEEFAAVHYQTTETIQWFDFSSVWGPFEELAYKRLESDPRTLRLVPEPLSRLYRDLGLALIRSGEFEAAALALKQAIRWNPMDCKARLSLAELCAQHDEMDEYLALNYTVLERASDPADVARAFLHYAQYYRSVSQPRLVAACLFAAKPYEYADSTLAAALHLVSGGPEDSEQLSPEDAEQILAEQGLPVGVNVEVVICLLTAARILTKKPTTNEKSANEKSSNNKADEQATLYVSRARELAGQEVVASILDLLSQDSL